MARRRRELLASFICLYIVFSIIYCLSSFYFSWVSESNSSFDVSDKYIAAFSQRKLLEAYSPHITSITSDPKNHTNCTRPDIEQFPRPLIGYEARREGGLIVHVLVALYMFLGLAILCDEYFVPSLEIMCKTLNIKSDVAGATFMAAGSSAPELATSIIAVFVAKDDIGISTVVGSAVYNIAFVIGICGLFAGRAIYLNWWPMFRDCVFYLISILALLFALRDESVTWVESVLFLSLYIIYVLFMFINHRVEVWLNSLHCLSRFGPRSHELEAGITYHALPNLSPGQFDTATNKLLTSSSSEILSSSEPSLPSTESEEGAIFSPPSGFFRKSLWIVSLPILVGGYLTIPDCRKSRWEKWFFATFFISCTWIGFMSYILVWMITIIGYTLGIRDTIMGLTFLAAGDSIPDAISSLLVVRNGLVADGHELISFVRSVIAVLSQAQAMVCKSASNQINQIFIERMSPDVPLQLQFSLGPGIKKNSVTVLSTSDNHWKCIFGCGYGDMAVSNAIGSNVFDILLCLGLPWFLQTVIVNPGSKVPVHSKGLTYSTLTLLLTIVFLLVATHLNSWKLNKKYGAILLAWYGFFMVIAIMYESSLFGNIPIPTCPSDY